MIETWFISDTHFGHKNILQYEKEARPFSSIEEMNEVMIENWNRVVKKNDIVYHLGDFAFGRLNIKIAERLNGKKKLVMGNHDTYPTSDYLKYFDKLYGIVFYERCILSHVPVHVGGLGNRWILNVHGHLHSKKVRREIYFGGEINPEWREEDQNYFNVSCEQNNLTPIHKDLIVSRLKEIS
jgi:calcineurin-like phosphoesterase family protein